MLIGGIDEAGRGSLAGPVVSAIVAWHPARFLAKDSKSLSPKIRDEYFIYIKNSALGLGIGLASVEEIDIMNIQQATLLSMKRALLNMDLAVDVLIIDGINLLPGIEITQIAFPKGDLHIPVVSAASIVAKVVRDEIMKNLSYNFPEYGWEKNKGYGTNLHRESILRWGPCIHHRKSFLHE